MVVKDWEKRISSFELFEEIFKEKVSKVNLKHFYKHKTMSDHLKVENNLHDYIPVFTFGKKGWKQIL